jgi:hypothetical protein
MDDVFVECFTGSDLCDELIIREERPYRARARVCVCVCVIVCDLSKSTTRQHEPYLDCCVTKIIMQLQ